MQSKLDRIKELDAQLNSLHQERSKIEKEFAAEMAAASIEKIKEWGLNKDSNIVLFTKESGRPWNIAHIFKIKEIDFDNAHLDTLHLSYEEFDYEYFARAQSCRISFSSLIDFENEFNLYIVDSVQAAILSQYFCELKLNYQNYKKYEELIAKNASLSIKTSV